MTSLAYHPTEVRLLVRSTGGAGRGRMTDDGGGYGIAGMRERAELLHGSVRAGEVEGGWEVELSVPA